jgi:glycosyltransferase involved in cell wall biosynthesis
VLDAGVASSLGIPVVSTVHGFGAGTRLNRFYHWLQRQALRRFDAVVAVSLGLEEHLAASGIRRERLHYIQNGWIPDGPPLDRASACRRLGIIPNGFRVGWVGRLSDEKGPDILVDAIGQLTDLPFHADFVGSGPMRQRLEHRSSALNIADRIRWHGLVPGAGRLLPAFGVLVLSSRAEGTPMVLLEAMAAGVPVIASRVGGIPEVVSSSEALLVPGGDPGAIALAVRNVIANPGAAQQRAAAARERLAREFGYARWLQRYEAVYRTVRRAR